MKAVIYARESSDDTGKCPSIAEQIKRAEQYITEQGYQLLDTYSDNGFSGGDWTRPEWNRLIREAKGHKFNIVIVWNTDRIARDTEQFLYFNRIMKESYVKVYSLTEGLIELEGVGDTAKFTSIAMANEIFRKVTSEKVKRTYESKKKACITKGIPFSWGRVAKQYDIQAISRLRASGMGFRTIAKQFNCSYQTIRRLMLQNTPQENKQIIEDKSENKLDIQNNPI